MWWLFLMRLFDITNMHLIHSYYTIPRFPIPNGGFNTYIVYHERRILFYAFEVELINARSD